MYSHAKPDMRLQQVEQQEELDNITAESVTLAARLKYCQIL